MKKTKFEDFILYSNGLTLFYSTLWSVIWKKNINKIITANLVIQTNENLSQQKHLVFLHIDHIILFKDLFEKIMSTQCFVLFILWYRGRETAKFRERDHKSNIIINFNLKFLVSSEMISILEKKKNENKLLHMVYKMPIV